MRNPLSFLIPSLKFTWLIAAVVGGSTPSVDTRRGLPYSPRPSQSQGKYRPLPLPPGATPAVSSPPFPEPDAYHEPGVPSRPTNQPADSYTSSNGSDLLHQASIGSIGSHRVFPSPGGISIDGQISETEDLPPYGDRTDASSAIYAASSSKTGLPPNPEWALSGEGYQVPVTRSISTGPTEQVAPSIPVPDINHDQQNGADAYAYAGVEDSVLDGYHYQSGENHNYRSPDPSHRAPPGQSNSSTSANVPRMNRDHAFAPTDQSHPSLEGHSAC